MTFEQYEELQRLAATIVKKNSEVGMTTEVLNLLDLYKRKEKEYNSDDCNNLRPKQNSAH